MARRKLDALDRVSEARGGRRDRFVTLGHLGWIYLDAVSLSYRAMQA